MLASLASCGGAVQTEEGETRETSSPSPTQQDTEAADLAVCADIDLQGTLIINNADPGNRNDGILGQAMLDLDNELQDRGAVSAAMDEAAQELYEVLVAANGPSGVDEDVAGQLRVGVRTIADICTELGFVFDGD